MIDYLIIIICIIAIATKDRTSVLYAFLLLSHNYLTTDFSGWYYYFTAALFDLFFIASTSLVSKPCCKYTHLLCLSFCSILLNFYGWVVWYNYLTPGTYINGFIALYFLAILILLRGQSARIDNYSIFCSANNKSLILPSSLP
jgi:hypothetical protein